MNLTTCCFTGHRPQTLPWKFNEQDKRCLKMKIKLRKEIENAIKKGFTTFICGMALGFDIICAETVLELKEKYHHIKLIGALPCLNQDKFWKEEEKKRYKHILGKLDNIRCVYDKYIGKQCMIERNKYMVDNSSLIIALFCGKNGGTKQTLDYAKSKNLKIVYLKDF